MPVIEHSAAIILLWAILGYLIGSVPFGVIITQAMGLGNLRDIGSGNIGATNVLRTGNKTAAALTLLLDGGKGALAVFLGRYLGGEDTAQIAGLMAMFGHCYPIWLRFKGGKGVATFLGIMLAFSWIAGLACCLTWLVGALIFRISSMGAVLAASCSTLIVILTGNGSGLVMTAILTLLILWRHRGNLSRIKAGTEPRIGQKK
ncbi:MAG: glycerol-3-phosphate 1-O-acyltransferase PlsY [Sulfitobacter sp.]